MRVTYKKLGILIFPWVSRKLRKNSKPKPPLRKLMFVLRRKSSEAQYKKMIRYIIENWF